METIKDQIDDILERADGRLTFAEAVELDQELTEKMTSDDLWKM